MYLRRGVNGACRGVCVRHSRSEPYGQEVQCWSGNRENQLVHATPQEEPWACRNGSAQTTASRSSQEPRARHGNSLCTVFIYSLTHTVALCFFAAMLQADDEDDMMEMQMKSPFGSSFRTFNATDYKPIGKASCPQGPLTDLISSSF